jgi:acetylornithine deacetylase
MNPFELTRALIDIPSVSGNEAAAGRYLAQYLETLGYKVQLQEVATDRFNVVALASEQPCIFLSTHLDTVPPFIASHEDDHCIYGRGSCDAKGIVAAQVAAAERLRASGIKTVGLLFLVDEEFSSLGATKANELPVASSCCFLINGEPTENKLALGSKGSLRLMIRTTGRAAHSAYPEQGESAIEKLLDVLADLRGMNWPSDELLGETTVNIGIIEGGTAANVVPGAASAKLQIRLVSDVAPVKSLLEQALDGKAEVEYLSHAQPVRLKSIDGFETCVVRFTTDISHLTKWGTPLLLGPGSILYAHTAQEKISKLELMKAVELYERLVRTLLSQTSMVS